MGSKRWASLIVLLVSGFVLVQPAVAFGQGLPYTYTYRDATCGIAVASDPMNIVFVHTLFTPEVDVHWQEHLPSWTTAGDAPSQFAINGAGACVPMTAERADGGNFAPSRFHARMTPWGFGNEPVESADGTHVHVAAHHEELGFLGPFPVPPVPVGHVVSEDGFNRARNEVYWGFVEHHPLLAIISWGNTRSMLQNDGRTVAGDGQVFFFDINHGCGGGGVGGGVC